MGKIAEMEDPVQMKKVKINNYKEEEWKKVCTDVMAEGVRLKFVTNQELKNKLLQTGSKNLIEANPRDTYRGVGKGLYDKKLGNKNEWGRNELGKILMQLRSGLK